MRSYDLGKLSILVLEKHLLVRRLLIDVFSEFGAPTVHSTPELLNGLGHIHPVPG